MHVPDIAVVWFGWDLELGTSCCHDIAHFLRVLPETHVSLLQKPVCRQIRGVSAPERAGYIPPLQRNT